MRVLLVEDEPSAARMLAKGLREQTYAVDVAATGEQALAMAGLADYDAIVLDVLLPGRDGLEVCRCLRSEGTTAPVLMLTARDAVDARIAGLDSGADDYLTKPFDLGELLARLRALQRRSRLPLHPTIARVGMLELDLGARRARRAGCALDLTRREYALLEFLALHVGQVMDRTAIAEHVWDQSYDPMSNVIDVSIQRLRRKIDLPGHPSMIVTRRGEGYMLTEESSLTPTGGAARVRR